MIYEFIGNQTTYSTNNNIWHVWWDIFIDALRDTDVINLQYVSPYKRAT